MNKIRISIYLKLTFENVSDKRVPLFLEHKVCRTFSVTLAFFTYYVANILYILCLRVLQRKLTLLSEFYGPFTLFLAGKRWCNFLHWRCDSWGLIVIRKLVSVGKFECHKVIPELISHLLWTINGLKVILSLTNIIIFGFIRVFSVIKLGHLEVWMIQFCVVLGALLSCSFNIALCIIILRIWQNVCIWCRHELVGAVESRFRPISKLVFRFWLWAHWIRLTSTKIDPTSKVSLDLYLSGSVVWGVHLLSFIIIYSLAINLIDKLITLIVIDGVKF